MAAAGGSAFGKDCVERLRVLADPTRLQVMELLLEGERTAGEIRAALQVEASLLSHHLRVLREAGLVTGQREGRSVVYATAPEVHAGPGTVNLGCCRVSFVGKQP